MHNSSYCTERPLNKMKLNIVTFMAFWTREKLVVVQEAPGPDK